MDRRLGTTQRKIRQEKEVGEVGDGRSDVLKQQARKQGSKGVSLSWWFALPYTLYSLPLTDRNLPIGSSCLRLCAPPFDMQQVFGGNTYLASNNLYQPNYRINTATIQTPVADVPSYTKILCATSFQSDPPPAFAITNPVLSGQGPSPPASYDASEFDTDSFLPPGFLVDWHKIPPLIIISELKQYVKLLGAFENLLKHVRDTALIGTDEQKCKAFYAAATCAFDAWASGHRTSRAEARPAMKPEDLPTLQVLMAWHAYMVNPRWYFEDGIRLGSLGAFPLSIIVSNVSRDG
jgi:hypothetical protein